jgi:hypothetical protein
LDEADEFSSSHVMGPPCSQAVKTENAGQLHHNSLDEAM